jgi:DNA-binding NarL/FixJ family response regulator
VTIRLLLADDHPIVLDGLERVFQSEPDISVVDRCMNGEEALVAVRTHSPDVLLLDVRMPKMDGIKVLRALREEGSSVKVVVLTADPDSSQMLEAIRLGVRGVLLKEQAPSLVVQCVREVHAGETWIGKQSYAGVLEDLLRRGVERDAAAGVLTPRESQLAALVARGLRNREIGDQLGISEGTVKIHLHRIYEKIGVANRVELTLFAQKHGLARSQP